MAQYADGTGDEQEAMEALFLPLSAYVQSHFQ